jgi:hypothetical protein
LSRVYNLEKSQIYAKVAQSIPKYYLQALVFNNPLLHIQAARAKVHKTTNAKRGHRTKNATAGTKSAADLSLKNASGLLDGSLHQSRDVLDGGVKKHANG